MTESLTPPPEHTIARKGWKSSEFWLSIGAVILPLALNAGHEYLATLPTTSPLAIVGGAIVAGGYAISRGQVKASRNNASAIVSAAIAAALTAATASATVPADGDAK